MNYVENLSNVLTLRDITIKTQTWICHLSDSSIGSNEFMTVSLVIEYDPIYNQLNYLYIKIKNSQDHKRNKGHKKVMIRSIPTCLPLTSTKVLEKIICMDSFADLFGRAGVNSLDSALIMANKEQNFIFI